MAPSLPKDDAKLMELKELLLVVRKIDAYVDRASTSYDRVIRVWTKVLNAMECF